VDADGIIWAKEVEDYQRFGVIVTDAGGLHDPHRREAEYAGSHGFANIGFAVHQGLESRLFGRPIAQHAGTSRPGKGRRVLSPRNAFQYMVGPRPPAAPPRPVAGWGTTGGKVDTLLEDQSASAGARPGARASVGAVARAARSFPPVLHRGGA